MMLLAVAVAGALGALARWGLDQAVRAGLARTRRRGRGAEAAGATGVAGAEAAGDAKAAEAAEAAGAAALASPGAVRDFGASSPVRSTGGQPTGIVVVNVVGCFLAGLVAGAGLPPAPRTLLLTGFLGGFTTFSTAVLDLAQLGVRRPGRALAVGGATLVAGLGAARLGLALAGATGG